MRRGIRVGGGRARRNPVRLNPERAYGGVGPGVALVAVGSGAALVVHAALPVLSPLVLAVVLGAVFANSPLASGPWSAGTDLVAHRLLRVGIVLLGLRLALDEVVALGWAGLVAVVAVVVVAFSVTLWLGARLGVRPTLSLLIAAGFSICGASAIAAVRGVSDADDADVAFGVGLVTLCGTLAILLMPAAGDALGLSPGVFGAWTGASVHDVGQVVATASAHGSVALEAAVVVKLIRVALLAPLVIGISIARRGSRPAGASRLVPLFIVGFLGAVVLRSADVLPAAWLSVARGMETVALVAALFALGTGVRVRKLRRLGGRPLVLGLAAWPVVAVVALAAVHISGLNR